MISANPMLHGSHPKHFGFLGGGCFGFVLFCFVGFFLHRLLLTAVKGLCKTKCGPRLRVCSKRHRSISFTGVCSVLSLYTSIILKFMVLQCFK